MASFSCLAMAVSVFVTSGIRSGSNLFESMNEYECSMLDLLCERVGSMAICAACAKAFKI